MNPFYSRNRRERKAKEETRIFAGISLQRSTCADRFDKRRMYVIKNTSPTTGRTKTPHNIGAFTNTIIMEDEKIRHKVQFLNKCLLIKDHAPHS